MGKMNKMGKRDDNAIPLTREQKENAVAGIKDYIFENFDADIGNLQAEMFLDYISANFGAYYYNRGIADSMGFMNEKIEDFYLLMKDENV